MKFNFKTSESNLKNSWDLLLRIVLKICESDVVSAIGSFHFRGNDLDIRAPDIRNYDYVVGTGKERKYELMSGSNAIDNKLAGLYVLKGEEIRKYMYGKITETSHYIEPGLNGIRQGINRLKSLYKDLKFFEFSIPVIWEMSKLAIINNERDYICGKCNSKECSISFNSFNEQHLETYNDPEYINHLNKIKKILDDLLAGKFDVRFQIEDQGQWIDPIEFSLLSKNEQGYYPIDDRTFEEALDRFYQELFKRSQEETRNLMLKIDEDIAKYKEKKLVDIRARERYERLQEIKRVMKAIKSYTDSKEKTSDSERKDKSE